MKFPKLKNRHICKLIVYAPAILLFLLVIPIGLLENYLSGGVIGALIIGGGIIVLAYLLLNFAWLMMTDAILEGIRVWYKARMYYKTDRNGKSVAEAERKILRRAKSHGKECEIEAGVISPVMIRRSCHQSMTIFWRAIEKISMVYSVSELDEKTYRTIVADSMENIRMVHKEPKKYLFEDKEQRNNPIATATAVIIIAERMDDKIPNIVLKEKLNAPCGEMLVGVCDISSGTYYFDAVRELHMLGLEGKPEKNYAFDLIRKIVFGGKLPLKGNDNYVLMTEDQKRTQEMSETTIWVFVKEIRKGFKEAIKEERALIKSFKYLGNGEVRMTETDIYCKYDDKLTSRPFTEQEDDPKKLAVCQSNQWIRPKKRTMSKKDMAEVEKLMETYLIYEGYDVEFVDFDEFYEDEGEQK